eukprot:2437511-Prymnesium_polylepis.1
MVTLSISDAGGRAWAKAHRARHTHTPQSHAAPHTHLSRTPRARGHRQWGVSSLLLRRARVQAVARACACFGARGCGQWGGACACFGAHPSGALLAAKRQTEGDIGGSRLGLVERAHALRLHRGRLRRGRTRGWEVLMVTATPKAWGRGCCMRGEGLGMRVSGAGCRVRGTGWGSPVPHARLRERVQ